MWSYFSRYQNFGVRDFAFSPSKSLNSSSSEFMIPKVPIWVWLLPLSAPSAHDHWLGLTLAPPTTRRFMSFSVELPYSYPANPREVRSQKSVDSFPPGDAYPPMYHLGPPCGYATCLSCPASTLHDFAP
jgi:hypothetical protein